MTLFGVNQLINIFAVLVGIYKIKKQGAAAPHKKLGG